METAEDSIDAYDPYHLKGKSLDELRAMLPGVEALAKEDSGKRGGNSSTLLNSEPSGSDDYLEAVHQAIHDHPDNQK